MAHTDPIADMLTRIRNAVHGRQRRVDVPASGLKREIAKGLAQEHVLEGYKTIDDRKQGVLRIYLKYAAGEQPVIQGIQRVSRPGLRRYAPKDEIPRVLDGLGISILSTSRGIMTGKECRKRGIGGEVLCKVW
jgi:small subunit ribosomal protein S8